MWIFSSTFCVVGHLGCWHGPALFGAQTSAKLQSSWGVRHLLDGAWSSGGSWLTEFRKPCAGLSKGNWNLTKLMRTFCANNSRNIEKYWNRWNRLESFRRVSICFEQHVSFSSIFSGSTFRPEAWEGNLVRSNKGGWHLCTSRGSHPQHAQQGEATASWRPSGFGGFLWRLGEGSRQWRRCGWRDQESSQILTTNSPNKSTNSGAPGGAFFLGRFCTPKKLPHSIVEAAQVAAMDGQHPKSRLDLA